MKRFAAKGKVNIQAQSDEVNLTAMQGVKVTSTEGDVVINAAKEILLSSGGAYVHITGGNI